MTITNAFSLRITELCKEKKISYYALSYNAAIPMSTLMNTIHRGNPTLETLSKICCGLDISLSQLFDADIFISCDEGDE